MATTTNFGWETPDDTDLVKDGAAAIRTALGGVDTSFVDLKGGTTGQVLAKASNTDLDFVWSADASGIPATIFDAKGDIIAASAADTAARLAVGTNGQVLKANSATATGLEWGSAAAPLVWSLVSTTALSGNTVVTLSGLSYKNFRVFVDGATSATTNVSVFIRPNGALNDYLGVYKAINTPSAYAATQFNGAYQNLQASVGSTGSSTATAVSACMDISSADQTTGLKPIQIKGASTGVGTDRILYDYLGFYTGTTAVTTIDIRVSAGTFNAGTVRLYGAN